MTESVWALRGGVADDWGFVIDSWSRSYSYSPWAKMVGARAYWDYHRGLIKDLVESGRGTLLMAVPSDDPDAIAGWVCTEGDRILHYAYTRGPSRRLGIYSTLVRPLLDIELEYTHTARPGVTIGSKWTFNPYLFIGR